MHVDIPSSRRVLDGPDPQQGPTWVYRPGTGIDHLNFCHVQPGCHVDLLHLYRYNTGDKMVYGVKEQYELEQALQSLLQDYRGILVGNISPHVIKLMT